VGPAVRRQLEQLRDPPLLAPEDWHNVLDPDAWRTRRHGVAGPLPVIGRHSRPDPLKWPGTRAETLLVYPEADDLRVRALGVDAALADRLAPIPANWQVLPFAAEGGVLEFLRGLDVYVYFHHPRWVEAFGRGLIEAMAAGLPIVLPRHFEALFGEAASYAEPAQAAPTVRALSEDPHRWRERSEAGEVAVRNRFSYPRHVARLAELIGAPSPRRAPYRPRRPRTVLFLTSNGVGLGHVTRGLAIAARCPANVEPVFVTLSQGARLIEEAGYRTEYLPFHAYLGAEVERWNRQLARELAEIVAFYDPSVIAFDGNTPYSGLVQTLPRAHGTWGVWVRRGFWREGEGKAALEREGAFDAVIEPADLAEIVDQGPTTRSRGRTRKVAPIRLLDASELLGREEARARLGLPQDHACVLLQLGAANNFDFTACQQRCLDLLLQRPKVTVAFLESPISLTAPELPPAVRPLRLFPASRCLRAFDFVVSAAGYNSFHELLLSGTPALFVPNEHPQMDDQRARAEHAARLGLGLALRTSELYRLVQQLELLLDPDERAAMRARMARLDPTNGAAEAAGIIAEMALTVPADRGG
jgi:hypothetical protein